MEKPVLRDYLEELPGSRNQPFPRYQLMFKDSQIEQTSRDQELLLPRAGLEETLYVEM